MNRHVPNPDTKVAAERYPDNTVGIVLSGFEDPDVLTIERACWLIQELSVAIMAAHDLERVYSSDGMVDGFPLPGDSRSHLKPRTA